MKTLQGIQQNIEETAHKSSLLDRIAQWPDWKIQALCLDESDLKIKETIQNWRQVQRQ